MLGLPEFMQEIHQFSPLVKGLPRPTQSERVLVVAKELAVGPSKKSRGRTNGILQMQNAAT